MRKKDGEQCHGGDWEAVQNFIVCPSIGMKTQSMA